MIIEIKNPKVLYFMISRFKKLVIYFYADWKKECIDFSKVYLSTSRKNDYSSIAFCQINVDLLPDIQELYDVNIYKSPCLITIKNGEITGKLYGNKPELFKDHMYDFSRS